MRSPTTASDPVGARRFATHLTVLALGAAFLVLVALLVAAPTDVLAKKKIRVDAKVTGTTLTVTGTPDGDVIALRLRPGLPGTLVVDVDDDGSEDFKLDRARFTTIVVNAGDGADTVLVDEANGVFTTQETTTLHGEGGADALSGDVGSLTLDGGPGDDTIGGSDAPDTILGGDGADTLDGNRGEDVVLAGADDDTMQWDPGDGSDTLEGQAGSDTLLFNGSNINEIFDVSANGGRVRFTRNVANITMDLNDVEHIDLRALGGADTAVVRDLTGTDLVDVAVDLAAAGGGGDGQADSVTVEGTAGDDSATLHPAAGGGSIGFGPLSVAVSGQEAADTLTFDGLGGSDTATAPGTAAADTLTVTADGLVPRVSSDGLTSVGALAENLVVNGLGGPDTFGATGNLAALTRLILDGGPGADTIGGGNGADLILGGDGTDVLDGNQGDDTMFGGADDDTFVWNPGDGSDTLEGQAGSDTLLFNGSNINEIFDVSANGGRVRFTRNVANITMDLNDVEHIDLRALGGADTAVVRDLTGTDLVDVAVDLAAAGGGGDGQADSVTVEGTAGDDSATLHPAAGDGSIGFGPLSVAVSGHVSGRHADLRRPRRERYRDRARDDRRRHLRDRRRRTRAAGQQRRRDVRRGARREPRGQRSGGPDTFGATAPRRPHQADPRRRARGRHHRRRRRRRPHPRR